MLHAPKRRAAFGLAREARDEENSGRRS